MKKTSFLGEWKTTSIYNPTKESFCFKNLQLDIFRTQKIWTVVLVKKKNISFMPLLSELLIIYIPNLSSHSHKSSNVKEVLCTLNYQYYIALSYQQYNYSTKPWALAFGCTRYIVPFKSDISYQTVLSIISLSPLKDFSFSNMPVLLTLETFQQSEGISE